MENDIQEIITNLKNNRYPNEAQISQGVVRRILTLLNWPMFEPGIVISEYSLNGRRVDLALCNRPNQPIIFIEVKQLGQCEGADRQLFLYAFDEGIPIAILTDGREWSFYLPGEQGQINDRCFYKLDLFYREIPEIIDSFRNYLGYENVISGRAQEKARADYKNVSKKRIIKNVFPKAWAELIEQKDEFLYEAVASKIESICGYKPEFDDVLLLMQQLEIKKVDNNTGKKVVQKRNKPTGVKKTGGKFTYTLFNNKEKECKNGRDLTRQIFNDFYKIDDQFFKKFLEYPKGNNKRPYLSKSKEELYPGSPQLMVAAVELTGGWWLDGNQSLSSFEKLIKIACIVMKVNLGSELVYQMG